MTPVCLFARRVDDGVLVVGVYVDDIIVAHNGDKHLSLTLHFPGLSKALSGIDPSLHDNIRSSGGLVAYSDATWRRPDALGFNMFGFVVYLMGAPVSFTSKQLKVAPYPPPKLSTPQPRMHVVK